MPTKVRPNTRLLGLCRPLWRRSLNPFVVDACARRLPRVTAARFAGKALLSVQAVRREKHFLKEKKTKKNVTFYLTKHSFQTFQHICCQAACANVSVSGTVSNNMVQFLNYYRCYGKFVVIISMVIVIIVLLVKL